MWDSESKLRGAGKGAGNHMYQNVPYEPYVPDQKVYNMHRIFREKQSLYVTIFADFETEHNISLEI